MGRCLPPAQTFRPSTVAQAVTSRALPSSFALLFSSCKRPAFQISAEASISVRMYLVKTYTYAYSGPEIRKAGRLQELKSNANDDARALEVTAWATVDGLMVWNGNMQRPTKGDVWTTTYWRLPDAALRNGLLHLLDADTGKDLYGTLQFIDWQEFNVVGQKQKCSHYRLT